jgi:hypothetical protein
VSEGEAARGPVRAQDVFDAHVESFVGRAESKRLKRLPELLTSSKAHDGVHHALHGKRITASSTS